ncbi:MAG: hypothetical protein Q9220_004885 [cf. Caloplaca sp. 1 TL-2023]
MLRGSSFLSRHTTSLWLPFLRQYSSFQRPSVASQVLFRTRSFHLTGIHAFPKRRKFFSSNPHLQDSQQDPQAQEVSKAPRKKNQRSPAVKNSLRRVAVEAQRYRDGKGIRKGASEDSKPSTKTVTAYCATEQYDISRVTEILRNGGHHLDPYETGLYPQVVHIEVPNRLPSRRLEESGPSTGDVFIFPSGTVVAWDVPESTVSLLVSQTLSSAAQHPHPDQLEEEDLEYMEDPTRDASTIKGDTIVIGTRAPSSSLAAEPQQQPLDTTLTKIAFSSGLARSTKLAVLETLLSTYLASTLSIPRLLSLPHGFTRLPFTRSSILRKTGQLLLLRAQLNLYSELTDSLPDLFWDSKHELGLEGYYDMVGRVLDTNVRIKVLNEKLDYAQEIAQVARQQLSERHGIRLEWIIILLIAVEVGFAVRQEIKDMRGIKPSEDSSF